MPSLKLQSATHWTWSLTSNKAYDTQWPTFVNFWAPTFIWIPWEALLWRWPFKVFPSLYHQFLHCANHSQSYRTHIPVWVAISNLLTVLVWIYFKTQVSILGNFFFTAGLPSALSRAVLLESCWCSTFWFCWAFYSFWPAVYIGVFKLWLFCSYNHDV